jgi:hypothetical protein
MLCSKKLYFGKKRSIFASYIAGYNAKICISWILQVWKASWLSGNKSACYAWSIKKKHNISGKNEKKEMKNEIRIMENETRKMENETRKMENETRKMENRKWKLYFLKKMESEKFKIIDENRDFKICLFVSIMLPINSEPDKFENVGSFKDVIKCITLMSVNFWNCQIFNFVFKVK